MINQFRKLNFYVMICVDSILFIAAFYFAFAARYSFEIPDSETDKILVIIPWLISTKLVVFFFMGSYRGVWRYTSLPDVMRLARASALSSLIFIAVIMIVNRFEGYPRSVFLADCVFTIFFCGGFRAAIRMSFARYRTYIERSADNAISPRHQTRMMILGAGDAAEELIRDVQAHRWSPYTIACCLDDDPTMQHRTILGVEIHGPISRLPDFVKRFSADEILIAMPSAGGDRMREIIALCEASGLPFKTIPTLSSLINGNVTINDIRAVDFEDLLGRPPVKLDIDMIGQYLAGKTVAITGAGGSIGSEICRQIIRFKPASLLIIESSEFNIYRMELELRNELNFTSVFTVMGRVQDRVLMDRVFGQYRPEVVFHAAAYKHVPIVELNPWEAIFNNIVGSQVIMDTAEKHGVERCVMISSDKAVRPTNVMGATKRVMEILLQTRPAGKTRFMAVRFGNVVGSSGSAIPLFQSQIKAGGPVTVTHPEMTRFFMTIPEACQLVLQAGALGQGSEIFVLKMGTPVKIAEMARDLIRLSGKEPDRDIKIVYTGLRPGEKLYEELITQGEGIVPTSHNKIMLLRLNHSSSPDRDAGVQSMLTKLVKAASSHDSSRIKVLLQLMVPEYTPSDSPSVLSVTGGDEA